MAAEHEPEPGMRDALREARELLSSVKSPDATKGSAMVADQVLECAFRLLESVYTTIGSGKRMTLSASDSTVVKAILELVVRWGIYPHLSPGVGIPLEKRFGEKSAASAAAALKEHVSGEGSGSLNLKPSDGAPTSLLQSAEFLAGLILDRPRNPRSRLSEMDFGTIASSQPSKQVQGSEESSNPGLEGEESSLHQATQFLAAALHQLVIFHHLPDICAAFLQLSVSGKEEWKKLATERMNEMVRALPVAHLVEALLVLLGQTKPEPPTWLKEKAGRMLSKLLLREGGVVASMERLVGGIQEGNVKAYEHIASHLAKVPRYITTTQAYYEAVCLQLPPLFLGPLPGQEGGLKEGTSTARLVVNMHHTAVIMACKLASRDIKLSGEYLFMPLLRPLVSWGMQIQSETSVDEGRGESEETRESSLVNAVLGFHIFLTAGADGADRVREFLVPQIVPITGAISALNYLLEPARSSVSKQQQGASRHSAKGSHDSDRQTSSKATKAVFEKGFLENRSLGYAAAEGPPSSILDKLRAALSDILEVLHEEQQQPVFGSVPPSSVLNAVKVEWPRHDGQIWAALNYDR